jgi:predicted O-methyltransferase YrrM
VGRGGNATATAVSTALRNACTDHLSREERAWCDRIEALRAELEACDRQIPKTDYGAGTRRMQRTEAEAYRGIVTTTSVSRASRASQSRVWALFLFGLVRRLRPRRCLELGTCVGISAAYQAAALQLNGAGTLVTLEGDPALAALATDNLDGLGLGDDVHLVPGRFQDTLQGVLEEHGPVDHAFIDGHHDGTATLGYFEQLLPHLERPALLVFDDVSWPGMRPAWHAITVSDAVHLSWKLGDMGVCVI